MEDKEVSKITQEVESEINGKGRVLFRQSGTEPVIRIMVESESEKKCVEYAERIAKVIKARGYYAE